MSKEKERALHALAVSERKIQRIDTKIDAARDQLALMLKLRREEVAKYNYLAANPVLENTEDEDIESGEVNTEGERSEANA